MPGTVMHALDGTQVIPQDANRIYIDGFQYEDASNAVLAGLLTMKLRDRINFDGRLGVVSSHKESDIAFSGKLSRFEHQILEYGPNGEPLKKRMRITIRCSLDDVRRARKIFFNEEVQAFEVYSDTVFPVRTEMQVKESLMGELAARLTEKIATGWYTGKMTPAEKGK